MATLGAPFVLGGGEQSWNQLNVERNAANTAQSSALQTAMPAAKSAAADTFGDAASQKLHVSQLVWDSITSSRLYTTEEVAEMGGGNRPAPQPATSVMYGYGLLATWHYRRRRWVWTGIWRSRAELSATSYAFRPVSWFGSGRRSGSDAQYRLARANMNGVIQWTFAAAYSNSRHALRAMALTADDESTNRADSKICTHPMERFTNTDEHVPRTGL